MAHAYSLAGLGTSLTVYCITVVSGPTPRGTTIEFSLDGDTNFPQYTSSTASSSSLSSYDYQYSVKVFSNSSLSNTLHTFTMTALQGSSASTLLFDYATYE